MIDQAVAELAPLVGVRAGCAAVGEAQARWYRRHRQSPLPPKPERLAPPQPRALSEVERLRARVRELAARVSTGPPALGAVDGWTPRVAGGFIAS